MTTTDQKIIKNRVGLLELAQQLGNVSQAYHALSHPKQHDRKGKLVFPKGKQATQFEK